MKKWTIGMIACLAFAPMALGSVSLRLTDADADGDGSLQSTTNTGNPFNLEVWIVIDPPLTPQTGVGGVSFLMISDDPDNTAIVAPGRAVNPDSKVMANLITTSTGALASARMVLAEAKDAGGYDNPYDSFDPDNTGPTTGTELLLTLTFQVQMVDHPVNIEMGLPALALDDGSPIDLDLGGSALVYTVNPVPEPVSGMLLVGCAAAFFSRRRRQAA